MLSQKFIVFGKTGNGKSTLCNVLSGTDIFAESGEMASMTKEHQAQHFNINGRRVTLVDTIGLGLSAKYQHHGCVPHSLDVSV